jgi:riboflavin kinase/FMN adenylyltransferase
MISVYRSLEEIPAGFAPCVAAIGNFDGVHLGHREILNAVVADAHARGLNSVAVTFDPHPDQFLRPAKALGLLTPMDNRIRLLAETGLDAVVVLRFDEELCSLSARQFVERVLVRSLGVRALHEGGNFRFGYKAEAGIEELAAFGREFGFTLTVHRAVHVHGLEVSSSAIRELVARGDMKRARWMLGRPFSVCGTPKRDRGVGGRLLVPTVNLAPYGGLLPAFGIYVTRLTLDGRCFEAVSSLGIRPTFEDAGFSVETHILDFEAMEIGEETPLELEFLLRLRDEEKFPSVEALKEQILRDIAKAGRYFRLRR